MDIKGICPAIAATFTDTGEYDYESYKNLIWNLIQNGCHGITLFAIAGEYYKLTEEEEKNLVRITVDECRQGGVPSIISITKHATDVAIKWAKYCEDAGADSLMLLPPFFLKPTAQNLSEHIKKVSKAVQIPIMVQYAPEQTMVSVDPAVFNKLSNEIENISFYKIECKPAGKYITSLLNATQNRVKVFVGNAGYQMIEGFDRGAIGVVPGCSMYDLYLNIYDNYFKGNRKKAIDLHNILLAMLNHIRQDVEMIIVYEKKILKKRGLIESDYCRQPTHIPDEYYLRLFEEYYELISPYLDGKR